jgi:hypothetical protein
LFARLVKPSLLHLLLEELEMEFQWCWLNILFRVTIIIFWNINGLELSLWHPEVTWRTWIWWMTLRLLRDSLLYSHTRSFTISFSYTNSTPSKNISKVVSG